MKGFLFFIFLLISISAFSQQYKVAVGSNITSFIFTTSTGTNPSFLRPVSGTHLSLTREAALGRGFCYDIGLNFNQFNNVGDTQNIPFSYQTDFIGIGGGIGPQLQLKKGFKIITKLELGLSKLINGSQFLQNHYVDLASDSQFNSLKTFAGYSFEIDKEINTHLGVLVKFQHLDNYSFGISNLNISPSTLCIGLIIRQ